MSDKYHFLTEQESQRLKAAMVMVGKNIDDIADVLNMTRPTLSNRLNGYTDFTRSEMEKFAKAVNRDPIELFLSA